MIDRHNDGHMMAYFCTLFIYVVIVLCLILVGVTRLTIPCLFPLAELMLISGVLCTITGLIHALRDSTTPDCGLNYLFRFLLLVGLALDCTQLYMCIVLLTQLPFISSSSSSPSPSPEFEYCYLPMARASITITCIKLVVTLVISYAEFFLVLR